MSSLKNLVKTRTYRERSQAQGDNYSFFESAALPPPKDRQFCLGRFQQDFLRVFDLRPQPLPHRPRFLCPRGLPFALPAFYLAAA